MAAVFVLPVVTAGQQGPVAAYLSTAGWAGAAERMLGRSWIVTPTGIIDPAEARRRGTAPSLSPNAVRTWRRLLPTVVKTAGKDLRQWRRSRRFRIGSDRPWADEHVHFVWQRHELFHTSGLELARNLGVPSVLFVPATHIWEAEQWGVHRPGWGARVEEWGERPALAAADVVACGSPTVAEQAMRIGTPEDRIVITPTGVDLNLFTSTIADRARVRGTLGIDDRFVIGWVGSFRSFHALGQALDAVARVDGATLLLVGDGPERPGLEREAQRRNVPVVFAGTVNHADLAHHLAAMDAAIVLSTATDAFHYSPLKLAEYLALGLPVVAPDVATIAERFHHDHEVILIPPGDTNALVVALIALRDDEALRTQVATNARAAAKQWTWDRQIERVLARLGDRD